MLTINNLEKCFYEASQKGKKYIGVKLQMKNFVEPAIIIFPNKNFSGVLEDYKDNYNFKDLTLRGFEDTGKILDFTYGDSFESIEKDLLK